MYTKHTTSGGRKGTAIWTPLLLTVVVSIFLQYQNILRIFISIRKKTENIDQKSLSYRSIGKILVNGGSILAILDIQLIVRINMTIVFFFFIISSNGWRAFKQKQLPNLSVKLG